MHLRANLYEFSSLYIVLQGVAFACVIYLFKKFLAQPHHYMCHPDLLLKCAVGFTLSLIVTGLAVERVINPRYSCKLCLKGVGPLQPIL